MLYLDVQTWSIEVFRRVVTGYSFNGVIYDKACLALRSLQTGENAGRFPALQSKRWSVDRFHSIGHSPRDEFCRLNCNPYRPQSNGLVRVLAKQPYIGREPLSLDDPKGTPMEVRFHDWKRVNGEIQFVEVTKWGRRVFMKEPSVNGEDDNIMEYHVVDITNTEAAEQAFSQLGKFAGSLRKMEARFGLFFLYCIIDYHNALITSRLEKRGMQPSPSASHMSALVGKYVDPPDEDDSDGNDDSIVGDMFAEEDIEEVTRYIHHMIAHN